MNATCMEILVNSLSKYIFGVTCFFSKFTYHTSTPLFVALLVESTGGVEHKKGGLVEWPVLGDIC